MEQFLPFSKGFSHWLPCFEDFLLNHDYDRVFNRTFNEQLYDAAYYFLCVPV